MSLNNIKSSLIDTPLKIANLLDAIHNLTTSPHTIPSLYLAAEGTRLSRHGTLAILQLFVPSLSHVYLIDVLVLGSLAFSTPSSSKGPTFTLQAVLESTNTLKVFFDVRNDSDALFSLHGIQLGGVIDLQLMELAARKDDDRAFVRSLQTCIFRHSRMTGEERDEWLSGKEKERELCKPGVFDVRPLREEVCRFWVRDVLAMPELWAYYEKRLSKTWKGIVLQTSRERIADSQGPDYGGKGRKSARGPWPLWEGWEDTVGF